MNYRKFYENFFGVKLNKSFDVYHIDFNKENNSINNLVAVPKELHLSFHSYAKIVKDFNKCGLNLEITSNFEKGYLDNEFFTTTLLKDILKFIELYYEMCA